MTEHESAKVWDRTYRPYVNTDCSVETMTETDFAEVAATQTLWCAWSPREDSPQIIPTDIVGKRADKVREGQCPVHDVPLERLEESGWCESCGAGWSIRRREDGRDWITYWFVRR